jgi:hypothetical protein
MGNAQKLHKLFRKPARKSNLEDLGEDGENIITVLRKIT